MIDDLPACCALISVCAAEILQKFGVKRRALAITYKKRLLYRHIILCFEFEDRIRAYDVDGTTTLSKKINFDSNPTLIAKDWNSRTTSPLEKVIRGEWY